MKEFSHHGIDVGSVSVNLPNMLKQKEGAVTGLTKGIEGLFAKNKVTYAKGYGKLAGANSVHVDMMDGSKKIIDTKNIIIAAGSEPIELPFLKFDEKVVVSSTGALSLTKIPKKMVLIGAGVIGLELGSVWRRLGAEVEVIEFGDRVCPGMDTEIASNFAKCVRRRFFCPCFVTLCGQVPRQAGHEVPLRHQGAIARVVCVHARACRQRVCAQVKAASVRSDGVTLIAEPVKGGADISIDADVVLVAIGRRPRTEEMDLEKFGVKLDERKRVVVGEHLQTSVKGIYAIGDCIAGPMLAHKAEEEGIAVAEHLAGKHGHVNYDVIPGVVYTHPEVASVGKTEEELKAAGIAYKKGVFPFLANSRARSNGDSDGMVKFLTDAKTDKVLGCHMIGSNAGEAIAEACLAMEYGASCEDIARTCHAHPTLSEAVKEAAMAAYDKPIHM